MANSPLPPNPLLGRRTVLKGLLGASALAAVPGLAACGSGVPPVTARPCPSAPTTPTPCRVRASPR